MKFVGAVAASASTLRAHVIAVISAMTPKSRFASRRESVATNKVPNAPHRGAGRPEAVR